MAEFNLELLAGAIESVYNNAQSALKRKQTGILEQVIDIGGDGEAKRITWMSRLPSTDGKDRSYEMMRILLSDLHRSRQIQISELSVEFDCRIKNARNSTTPEPGPLVVVPLKRKRRRQENVHHLKISLSGPDTAQADVQVDGGVLKPIAAPDSQPDSHSRESGRTIVRRLFLSRFMRWFFIALMIIGMAGTLYLKLK